MSIRVRKRCGLWLVMAVALVLAVACGQRGDLYLPDDPPSAEFAPVESDSDRP